MHILNPSIHLISGILECAVRKLWQLEGLHSTAGKWRVTYRRDEQCTQPVFRKFRAFPVHVETVPLLS